MLELMGIGLNTDWINIGRLIAKCSGCQPDFGDSVRVKVEWNRVKHLFRQWNEQFRQWNEQSRQWNEQVRQWNEQFRQWNCNSVRVKWEWNRVKLLFSQVPAAAEFVFRVAQLSCFVAEVKRAVISDWLEAPSLTLYLVEMGAAGKATQTTCSLHKVALVRIRLHKVRTGLNDMLSSVAASLHIICPHLSRTSTGNTTLLLAGFVFVTCLQFHLHIKHDTWLLTIIFTLYEYVNIYVCIYIYISAGPPGATRLRGVVCSRVILQSCLSLVQCSCSPEILVYCYLRALTSKSLSGSLNWPHLCPNQPPMSPTAHFESNLDASNPQNPPKT